MALDEPSIPSNPNSDDGTDNRTPPSSAVNDGEDVKPATRLQRWTRQEIQVLVQGKSDAENRFKPGRNGALFGSSEPKWTLVSSYCEKHGVNRTPMQCKKRWGNLIADYKKIKEWESHVRDETESFWLMNVELRRERKLPGCFDREVYDILDPTVVAAAAETVSEAVGDDEEEAYDSNRKVSGEDGLFSALDRDEVLVPSKDDHVLSLVPISEKQSLPLHQGERKRKRIATDHSNEENEEEESLQSQLIEVLEKNGKMLSEKLEAQNINFQLDRQNKNENASNMVAVLDKLANAIGRIADKL